MRTIAITRADGGVSIMRLLPESVLDLSDGSAWFVGRIERIDDTITIGIAPVEGSQAYKLTMRAGPFDAGEQPRRYAFGYASVEGELAKWSAADRADVVAWREIDFAGVPTDRTFRKAWREHNAAIAHHMPTCREIWRDRIRNARMPLLAALDVAIMRGLENAADLKPITVAKQTLRDVTDHPAIEAAQTPDELKRVWPACLGPPPAQQTIATEGPETGPSLLEG